MHIFASKDPVSVPATEQAIGIYCVDGSDTILHVKAIPHLTNQLTYASVVKNHDQENVITTKHVTPKPLIGIDYFWDLIYSNDFNISRLSNGYRLLNTRIGSVVADKSFRQNQENSVLFHESSTAANPTNHT